jgi:ribosomal protein S27AE
MTKTQHVHKLKRLKYKSGNTIFFCSLPDCTFKTNIALALGKRSLCWRCGESFLMTEYSLRLSKPHCDNCHKPKFDKIEFDNYVVAEPEGIKPSFPENRELKQGEIPNQMTLAERIRQSIHKASEQEEEL